MNLQKFVKKTRVLKWIACAFYLREIFNLGFIRRKMKIKILATFILAAFLFIAGCGKDEANTNANNANKATVTTPTPVVKTSETAATDPALKSKIEAALKAKGFNDVTVDTSAPKMIIRGTVPKGKLGEVMATVQEANGGKPVDNQVAEK